MRNASMPFLAHTGTRACCLSSPWGRDTGAGRGILPGQDGMDGFFYALLQKTKGA